MGRQCMLADSGRSEGGAATAREAGIGLVNRQENAEERVARAVGAFARAHGSGGSAIAEGAALVEATSDLPLTGLDRWERLIREECTRAQGRKRSWRWFGAGKDSPCGSWLDLASGDGYRREGALRTLTGSAPNRFFFALALRRLNDWVPQVRMTARDAVARIAADTDPDDVTEVLCNALSTWTSWGRIEQGERQALLRILVSEGVAESALRMIVSSPAGPMPRLFAQLGRTPVLDDSLEDIARRAVQPSVRARAYRALFEGRITWVEGYAWEWNDLAYCKGRMQPVLSARTVRSSVVRRHLLKESADDRSATVRRVAAEFLIRYRDELGDDAQTLACQFAADSSRAVSERGRFALLRMKQQGAGVNQQDMG